MPTAEGAASDLGKLPMHVCSAPDAGGEAEAGEEEEEEEDAGAAADSSGVVLGATICSRPISPCMPHGFHTSRLLASLRGAPASFGKAPSEGPLKGNARILYAAALLRQASNPVYLGSAPAVLVACLRLAGCGASDQVPLA